MFIFILLSFFSSSSQNSQHPNCNSRFNRILCMHNSFHFWPEDTDSTNRYFVLIYQFTFFIVVVVVYLSHEITQFWWKIPFDKMNWKLFKQAVKMSITDWFSRCQSNNLMKRNKREKQTTKMKNSTTSIEIKQRMIWKRRWNGINLYFLQLHIINRSILDEN